MLALRRSLSLSPFYPHSFPFKCLLCENYFIWQLSDVTSVNSLKYKSCCATKKCVCLCGTYPQVDRKHTAIKNTKLSEIISIKNKDPDCRRIWNAVNAALPVATRNSLREEWCALSRKILLLHFSYNKLRKILCYEFDDVGYWISEENVGEWGLNKRV